MGNPGAQAPRTIWLTARGVATRPSPAAVSSAWHQNSWLPFAQLPTFALDWLGEAAVLGSWPATQRLLTEGEVAAVAS